MTDSGQRHYLLRVLGLSAAPRLITLGLTLISFPLMVRALGAAEYGILVFLSAITQVLESGADFGVSSAAGKNVAEARERRTECLRLEILQWFRLQASIATVALAPLLGMTYVLAMRSATIEVAPALVVVAVLSVWVNIVLNFTRAVLTSLLGFRSLAVVDTSESVTRSGMLLAVAAFFPSAMSLAVGTLLVALVASTVSLFLLARLVRRMPCPPASAAPLTTAHMLRESGHFLWLRFATRAFQSIPLIILGRVFGAQVVGVIGAFAKIVEMLNFPSAVMGNALAVRANGIVARGAGAVEALWDAAARFTSLSLVGTASVFVAANLIAILLVPGNPDAADLIALLAVTVTTTAVTSLIVPMSDYVGALRARNILLSVTAIAQAPILWFASQLGTRAAVAAHVGIQVLVTCGYLYVALRAFNAGLRLRAELRYYFAVCAVAFVMALFAGTVKMQALAPVLVWHGASLLPLAVLWAVVVLGITIPSRVRRHFLTIRFFDFEWAEAGDGTAGATATASERA